MATTPTDSTADREYHHAGPPPELYPWHLTRRGYFLVVCLGGLVFIAAAWVFAVMLAPPV